MTVRLTRKAKTISARADERRRIEATAKLCKEQGQKLVVSTVARTR